MSNNDVLKAYAVWFDKWPQHVGAKPTAEMLLNYLRLGCRNHGKQSLAGAMALRPTGVTDTEIARVMGTSQRNKMTEFVEAAVVKRVALGQRDSSIIRKLEITPKGWARIKRAADSAVALEAEGNKTADDKQPVKAKVTKKAVKAKGAVKKPRVVKVKGKADQPASGHITPLPVNELPAAQAEPNAPHTETDNAA